MNDLETIELQLLLEGIHRHYGYDFRDYVLPALARRIWTVARAEGAETISQLQDRVLHDPAAMGRLLQSLAVHVTAMFRDPSFYLTFRQRVVPLLRTYPFIRIWHAGCSTGEEAYSMAILLEEEGLIDRCRIYATDMSEPVLAQAREAILPLKKMREYTAAYQRSGGKRSFSEYYTAAYGSAILRPSLRDQIVFSQHNLAMDSSFNEFHVILCRNVMIYFNERLQARVHDLFYRSLVTLGVLGLGQQESLSLHAHETRYEELVRGERLYRRLA
jgi:chemotaxis protein methyltransferase CheR